MLNRNFTDTLESRLMMSSTLPAPTIIAPGGTAAPGAVVASADPTFSWDAVSGVSFTSYQINLEDLTRSRFVSFQAGASVTQFTPPAGALAAGDKFVWNLRLRDGDTTGAESAYFFFQTPAPAKLIAPTITGPGTSQSPGPVLTTSDPTFTWNAVSGVSFSSYQINLEDLTKNKFVSYQVSPGATQFTPPPGNLAAGDKFVWNLRLRRGDTTGPESAYFYFQTPAPQKLIAPTITGPGNSSSPGPVLTTSDPTFTWDVVTGVTFSSYQINLEDLSINKFVSYQVSPSATQFTPPAGDLAAGDKFVWNLRLRNGDTTGPESAYFYFQTPGATSLIAPTITGPGNSTAPGPVLTTSDPTFTWNAVTGVTFSSYQINLEDLTINKFVSYQVSPTATQFTPPAGDLAAGDKFVWKLRLRNGDTTGPESAYFFFKT